MPSKKYPRRNLELSEDDINHLKLLFKREYNFLDYLYNRRPSDDPLGELTQDILGDKEFPLSNDYVRLYSYLSFRGQHLLTPFRTLWKKYIDAHHRENSH